MENKIIVIMDHSEQRIYVAPIPEQDIYEVEMYLADEEKNQIKSFDSNVDWFISEKFDIDYRLNEKCFKCQEVIEPEVLTNYCNHCLTHQ